jgi:hypothetical protein
MVCLTRSHGSVRLGAANTRGTSACRSSTTVSDGLFGAYALVGKSPAWPVPKPLGACAEPLTDPAGLR